MQRARRRDGSDLRRELLAVTRDQLEAMGDPAAVTISSIVSAARCTPPSLYHYWPTRDALFAEASRSGWRTSSPANRTRSPVWRIRWNASARADGPIGTLPASGPPCSACSSSNRGVGTPRRRTRRPRRRCRGGDGQGRATSGNTHTVALTIWAAVHGVAALATAHPDTPRHVVDELADTAVDALLIGLH